MQVHRLFSGIVHGDLFVFKNTYSVSHGSFEVFTCVLFSGRRWTQVARPRESVKTQSRGVGKRKRRGRGGSRPPTF